MVSGQTNEMHWPGGPWGPIIEEGPPGGTGAALPVPVRFGVALPPPLPAGVAASDPELGVPHECSHHSPCHHSPDPALPPHQLILGGPPVERRCKERIGWCLQGDLALCGAPDQAGGTAIKPPAKAGALHSTRDHIMKRQYGNGNTGLRNDKAISPDNLTPHPQCPNQLATGNSVAHGHMGTTAVPYDRVCAGVARPPLVHMAAAHQRSSARQILQRNVHGKDHARRTPRLLRPLC